MKVNDISVTNYPVIDCEWGRKNVALILLGPIAEGLDRIYHYMCPHCKKLYPIDIVEKSKSVNYRHLRKRNRLMTTRQIYES